MDEPRKMRKATQHRVNPDTGKLEEYYIDVPLELEEWEKEGLRKQFEARNKRAADKKKKLTAENADSAEKKEKATNE